MLNERLHEDFFRQARVLLFGALEFSVEELEETVQVEA
jgi:hypothetical protein